jgi:hypothetical protein
VTGISPGLGGLVVVVKVENLGNEGRPIDG